MVQSVMFVYIQIKVLQKKVGEELIFKQKKIVHLELKLAKSFGRSLTAVR